MKVGSLVKSLRRHSEQSVSSRSGPAAAAASSHAQQFVVDVTTSLHYRGRPAVGIVRVEREVIRALLRQGVDVRFVMFDPARSVFVRVDRAVVESLFVSRPDGRSPAQDTGMPEDFHWLPGHLLVSAGLVWDHDFIEAVYRIKLVTSIKFVQIAYDIIPILMPEFCVPGMTERFPRFILNMIWTADVIFGISEATNRSLEKHAAAIGLRCPPLKRIELGCDVGRADKRDEAIRIPGLNPGSFALYVSTIEPRKNHQLLYHVWRRMAAERPDLETKLVFVGAKGWNSGDLTSIISQDLKLSPNRIKILSDIDDASLSWLYDNCLFTLYPSLWEGWGLPVAESLSRGKLCLASNSSSLPEASQDCAVLLDPLDVGAWYNAIVDLVDDPDKLDQASQQIQATFRPLNWEQATDRFVHDVQRLAGAVGAAVEIAS